ncbi:MAG TPA: hypothetical protein VGC54_00455, partial [Planctomycetota bacterium]
MTDPYHAEPGAAGDPGSGPPAPHGDDGALARLGPGGSMASQGDVGSLLRLRDVQALNRSFSRLAEVQESLLEHMVQMHEERRGPSRVGALVLAVCTAVLGVGLGLLAMAWLEQQRGLAPVTVSSAPPEIVVSPPKIEVLMPESSLDGELLTVMREQMDSLRSEREADRDMMRGLAEQLFQRETANLAALQQATLAAVGGEDPVPPEASAGGRDGATAGPAATGTAGSAAAALEVEGQRAPSEPGEEARTWLAVANGLLALDGYDYLHFDRGTRAPGTSKLTGVVLM